jgi:hypothetical protein
MNENPAQTSRYLLIYNKGVKDASALELLKDSRVYRLNPMSIIGAEIPQGLLKILEESGLFKEIKSDPVKE